MNTIYRIVFNTATGTWVVASELAKGPRKKASKTVLAATLLGLSATAGGLHAQGYAAGTGADASHAGTLNNGYCYMITNATFNCNNVFYGTAVGSYSIAGNGSVALGDHARVVPPGAGDTPFFGTAIGGYSQATAWATAVGASAMAQGQASVAIGLNSKTDANAFYTVAIGSSALATGTTTGGVALGANSNSTNGSVALGSGAKASNGGGAWSALAAGQNSNASGDGAAAVGPSASATGFAALAMGRGATTANNYGTAIGAGANAAQSWGIALGQGARTLLNGSGAGYGSMALGTNALATGIYNIALGQSAAADGASEDSIAIGVSAHSTNTHGIAIGTSAQSTNAYAIAIAGAASGDHATAIGSGANAAATTSLAIGQQAVAGAAANNAVALGYTSSVSAANAVAIGSAAKAAAANTIALGNGANAVFTGDIALGNGALTHAPGYAIGPNPPQNSIAMGSNAATYGAGVVAIGENAIGVNNRDTTSGSVAIGQNASAAWAGSVAIGPSATIEARDAVAIGNGAASTGNATAIGTAAVAKGTASLAQGANTTVQADYGVALGGATGAGRGATVTGDRSVAIGTLSNATAQRSVALGYGSVADRANTVSVGAGVPNTDGDLLTRQIVNVAAGTQSNDAVNVNQLKPLISSLGGNASINPTTGAVTGPTYLLDGNNYYNVGDALDAINTKTNAGNPLSVVYDDQTKDAATLLGKNGTQIKNVANATADSDAVNLGQLKSGLTGATRYFKANGLNDGTDDAVAAGSDSIAVGAYATARGPSGIALGDHANTSGFADGIAIGRSANAITLGGIAIGANAQANQNAISLGNAAQAGQNAIAVGEQAAAAGSRSVALGDGAGALGSQSVALGADSIAMADNVVSVGSAGNERSIVNVKAGAVNATSTDAVNGSQLYDVQLGVAAANRYFKADGANDGTDDASATGPHAVAVGAHAAATGSNAIAMGSGASVGAADSLAIGMGASATGPGGGASANAIGARSSVSGVNSNAFGARSTVDGVSSDAFGSGASVVANGSVAMGYQANVTGENSVALGAFSVADRDNVVSVGDSTLRRKIVNLDAGIAATDAVNVSQLQGITNALGGGATVNAISGDIVPPDYTVQHTLYRDVGNAVEAIDSNLTAIHGSLADTVVYDDELHNSLTLGGVTGRPPVALRNVADGAVHLTSTDAINGSQLFGVSTSLANALGGNAGVDGRGYVTAPSYAFDGTNYGSVGLALDAINQFAAQSTSNTASSLSAMDTQISTFDAKLADVNNQLTQVQSKQSKVATAMATTDPTSDSQGLLQQAAGENLTVGKDTDGAAIDFADKDGNTRTLSNVSAGVADTDAVNMGQLKSAGLVDSDGTMLDAMVYDPGSNRGSVTLGGIGATAPVVLSNVADGKSAHDAVNVGQLTGVQSDLQNQINSVNNQVTGIDGRVTQLEGNGVSGDAHAAAPVVADNAATNTATNGAGAVLGANAQATTESGTAVGRNAQASASNTTAVGANASATGANATAIGAGANGSADNSVALGANSVATQANSVSVGSAGNERTITNVAAGTARTDAANWGQVQDAVNSVQDWSKQKFTQLDKRINGMGAMSAAYGQMAFSAQGIDQPNKVGVGVGTQNGQSAIAVGYSRQIKPNFNVSFGGSASANDVSVGVGMAVGW